MRHLFFAFVVALLVSGCSNVAGCSNADRVRANANADDLCAKLLPASRDEARTLCDERGGLRVARYAVTCTRKKIDDNIVEFRVSVGVPALFNQIQQNIKCVVKK